MKNINFLLITLCVVFTTETFAQTYIYVRGKVEYKYNLEWRPVSNRTPLYDHSRVRSDSNFVIERKKDNKKFFFHTTKSTGEKVDVLLNRYRKYRQQPKEPAKGFEEQPRGTLIPAGKENTVDKPEVTTETFPENLHYFLVGIRDFPDSWPSLPDQTGNFLNLANSIEKKMVPDNEFQLSWHDVATSAEKTSTASLLHSLKLLSDSVKQNNKDMVMVYLLSHGERINDKTYRLITSDTQLDADTLNAYFKKMAAKGAKVLVFVDACYAKSLVNKLDSMNRKDDKCAFFFSSSEYDTSYIPTRDFTPLEKALANSVSGNELHYLKRFSTDSVTIENLFRYIRQYVESEFKDKNQRPERKFFNFREDELLWKIKPNLFDSLNYQVKQDSNVCAMVQLGDLYASRNSSDTAMYYYRMAYEQGRDPMAACRIGMYHYYKPQPDYDSAFKLFQEAAYQHCDLGRYYLSVCYAKGRGVKANPAKAKRYFKEIAYWDSELKKSWEKERTAFLISSYSAPEITTIRTERINGQILVFNPSEIYRGIVDPRRDSSIIANAKAGKAKAQAEAGDLFLYHWNKILRNRDYTQAYYWYNESAKQGDADGLYGMGVLCMNGLGVEKDSVQAYTYFRQAAEKGHPKACTQLGKFHFNGWCGLEKDTNQAVALWQKATARKDPEGFYWLGLCHKDGIIDPTNKNYKKAYACFKKSAKEGYAPAQYMVGWCLYNGEGVKGNPKEAEKWIMMAMARGYQKAIHFYNGCQ